MLNGYFTHATTRKKTNANYYKLKPLKKPLAFEYSLDKYILNKRLTNIDDETMEPMEQYTASHYPLSYPSVSETFTPSISNTETYLPLQPITTSPTFYSARDVNYTCVCKTKMIEDDKKIITLIIATSLTSFTCVLLMFFILWDRLCFKKKLMNKHHNNNFFLENFGVEGTCDNV